MRALGCAVARLYRDPLAQVALDGKVPALQIWRWRIGFETVRRVDAGSLLQRGGEWIGDRQQAGVTGGPGERLRDRIWESAGQVGADGAQPHARVEDAITAS